MRFRPDGGRTAIDILNEVAADAGAIIATKMANRVINRLGIVAPFEMAEEEGCSLAQVAAAYFTVDALFDLVAELATVRAEEFDAIVVMRIVRRTDDDTEVGTELLRQHGDRGRRQGPRQQHVHARGYEAGLERRLEQQRELLTSGFIKMEEAQARIQQQGNALTNAFFKSS